MLDIKPAMILELGTEHLTDSDRRNLLKPELVNATNGQTSFIELLYFFTVLQKHYSKEMTRLLEQAWNKKIAWVAFDPDFETHLKEQ
jgi:hypothetical protein